MKTILLATIVLLVLFICCGDIKDVSYSKDVQPILNEYCLDCHNSEAKLGNLNFENYEALMSSRYLNRTQPLVIAGEPMQSRLYLVTHSSNPAIRMPPENQGYGKLSESEITTIKVWIAEGGKNN
jgi:hypothetical protein